MTDQGKLPAGMKFLHAAVRPHGNRDDAGASGERLHKLADFIEKRFADDYVPKDESPMVILIVVEHIIGTAPDGDRWLHEFGEAIEELRAWALR